MRSIFWKISLRSDKEKVYQMISTDLGREKFLCEKSVQYDGQIRLSFPNRVSYTCKYFREEENVSFILDYFNSEVVFKLKENSDGSTDLYLENTQVPSDEYDEVNAGWVSVLMNLKAVVDHNVDLRNHDGSKTWDQGYADN